MLVCKLSTHMTILYCLCAYNWVYLCTGEKIIYITSRINKKLVKTLYCRNPRPKGGLVEQGLKNEDECSLPPNTSRNSIFRANWDIG